jgi:hypothetical protein
MKKSFEMLNHLYPHHILGLLRKDQLCLSSHVKTTDGDNMLLNKMADYSRKAVTVLSNSDLQDIR